MVELIAHLKERDCLEPNAVDNIKMVDLARYMMLYEGAPDSVSKGKQETVKEFKKRITAQWPKSDEEFNDFYYKRVVVLAIMYKRTDEIIRQTAWYKEKHSYKANVAVYTISLLFHYIRENVRGFELDFARIWNAQKLYPELERQISILSTEVYEFKGIQGYERRRSCRHDQRPLQLCRLQGKQSVHP